MSEITAPSSVTPRVGRRLPDWLRMQLPVTATFAGTRSLIGELNLHTVCESAKCPNHWECWDRGTATFMIGGDRCTRSCAFCAVDTAKPLPLDPLEPERVAEASRRLKLRHVVITAVARDDVHDGGAEHFQKTILAVRSALPGVTVEVLTPDFNDKDASLQVVLDAAPEVFNHNLETVRRLTPQVRSRATYDRSLSVLRKARERGPRAMHTKSGLMVGLGETPEEVIVAMRDLRAVGCSFLTIGQYLQPTKTHLPVVEFVTPAQFVFYAREARELGFSQVSSGPLVRSSYHAGEFVSPPVPG